MRLFPRFYFNTSRYKGLFTGSTINKYRIVSLLTTTYLSVVDNKHRYITSTIKDLYFT